MLLISSLFACGGGSGGGSTTGGSSGGGTTTPPEPAERFIVSGNNDGTLSVFRSNALTGYAKAQAYFPTDGFAIQDMVYDQGNGRIVLI